MNLGETKTMTCTPGFVWGQLGQDACKRRSTGEGTTFWERKRTRVSCRECGTTMAASSLRNHMERTHGRSLAQTQEVDTGVGGGGCMVSFPRVLPSVACPVEGLIGEGSHTGQATGALHVQALEIPSGDPAGGAIPLCHCARTAAWPSVHRNMGKSRAVWRQLGKLLRQEGADNWVLTLFYRAVIQTILLFGAESWALSDAMMRIVESAHVQLFLHQITRKLARQQVDWSWEVPAVEEMLKVLELQLPHFKCLFKVLK